MTNPVSWAVALIVIAAAGGAYWWYQTAHGIVVLTH
jgi:lysozyme family protein